MKTTPTTSKMTVRVGREGRGEGGAGGPGGAGAAAALLVLEEQEQEQEQEQVQACPSLNHSPLPRATTMLTQGGEGPEDVLVEWSRPPRNGHSLQHDDRTPLCTIPRVKWSR